MLWGVSAGMCEYRGCSVLLYEHHVTKEKVNLAERAHIYAFSKGGTRFSKDKSRNLINNIDNLMLVCGRCHKLIDNKKIDCSAETLLAMKKEHEERIRLIASIKPNLQNEVIIYNCNIADQGVKIQDDDAFNGIIPDYYPARSSPINLSPALVLFDNEDIFWDVMATDLERRFTKHNDSLDGKPISLFAIAPQPLLFKLGKLFNRHFDVSVRQPQGNISTWRWSNNVQTIEWHISEPLQKEIIDEAVITFEITAQLSDDELLSIFSKHRIYRIIAKNCSPSLIKSKMDLLSFAEEYRKVLNRIRKECNSNVNVSLLPIAPASISIEAGRQLMKGDPKITIYDRDFKTKNWVPTLSF